VVCNRIILRKGDRKVPGHMLGRKKKMTKAKKALRKQTEQGLSGSPKCIGKKKGVKGWSSQGYMGVFSSRKAALNSSLTSIVEGKRSGEGRVGWVALIKKMTGERGREF